MGTACSLNLSFGLIAHIENKISPCCFETVKYHKQFFTIPIDCFEIIPPAPRGTGRRCFAAGAVQARDVGHAPVDFPQATVVSSSSRHRVIGHWALFELGEVFATEFSI